MSLILKYVSIGFTVLEITPLRFVILATSEEYKLLERMNRATITKYAEMKDIATNISDAVKSLDEKCK